MATSAMISEQEYLTTDYEHDCEWIEGQVRERAMPDEFHSALQAFFIGYFLQFGRALGLRVRPELRVHVAARRYRVPDVTVLPSSAPLQAIPDTPPAICIEILSLDERKGELREKIADYAAMGVRVIWVVDPRCRRLWTADAAGMHPVESFQVPDSDLVITPGEMFAELDSLLERSTESDRARAGQQRLSLGVGRGIWRVRLQSLALLADQEHGNDHEHDQNDRREDHD